MPKNQWKLSKELIEKKALLARELDSFNSELRDFVQEKREEWDEKSEAWQEGDKGSAIDSWLSDLDSLDTTMEGAFDELENQSEEAEDS